MELNLEKDGIYEYDYRNGKLVCEKIDKHDFCSYLTYKLNIREGLTIKDIILALAQYSFIIDLVFSGSLKRHKLEHFCERVTTTDIIEKYKNDYSDCQYVELTPFYELENFSGMKEVRHGYSFCAIDNRNSEYDIRHAVNGDISTWKHLPIKIQTEIDVIVSDVSYEDGYNEDEDSRFKGYTTEVNLFDFLNTMFFDITYYMKRKKEL